MNELMEILNENLKKIFEEEIEKLKDMYVEKEESVECTK